MARTDLYYFICEWDQSVRALSSARSWRLFWEALVEEGPLKLRSNLPFAELATVTYDLSVREAARGAACFYDSLSEALTAETQSVWGPHLEWFLPITELPNELGELTGVADRDREVWMSLSPRVVEQLVNDAASLDWQELIRAGKTLRVEDDYIPDLDSFEGLVRGYHEMFRRCLKTNAGVVVLAHF